MFRNLWKCHSICIVVVVFCTGHVSGQPFPDPTLWNVVYNPSGDQIVPLFVYDQNSGVLSIDTLGLNRTDDTPDYTDMGGPILADDLGLVGLRIRTDAADGVPFPEFDTFGIFQGIFWRTDWDGSSYSLLGVPLSGTGNFFLWPDRYDWLQLPTGLTSNDFRAVDVDVDFDFGPGGGSLFAPKNGVTVVPEPQFIAPAAAAMALVLVLRRIELRSRKQR